MSEKSLKKALLKKSSSPYPERKKRPRLKFAWNREQAVDYENCKQIDIFIQDVIEKAKEDYLNTYSQQNGQCMDEDTPGKIYVLWYIRVGLVVHVLHFGYL